MQAQKQWPHKTAGGWRALSTHKLGRPLFQKGCDGFHMVSGVMAHALERRAEVQEIRQFLSLCDLHQALGQALVEAFCAVKESELQRFHAAVTDWEVREYAWHL